MQKVLVFQRDNMGAGKVAAISQLSVDIELKVVDVVPEMAPIIDYPERFFPDDIDELLAWADLVLDHLYHPDLTGYLLDRAEEAGKLVVASGRKVTRGLSPTTCCTLGKVAGLGTYGELFGAPKFKVEMGEGDTLKRVEVVRGAPCAATWVAAKAVEGLRAEDAVTKIGLETQFNCFAKANPNVFLENPLHVAGKIHSAALEKAIRAAK